MNMLNIQVIPYQDYWVTTSLNVSEVTGKAHKNVIADIERLIDKGINRHNFVPASYFIEDVYVDAKGESRNMYLLTKKGLFLYLFGSNIEVCLHILKTLDISNIFEALDDYSPIKIKEPYYLYLLQSGNSNVYKIGIAKDIDARIKNITHHDVLKLVKCWEFESKEDCRKVEETVHKALCEYKANREWFYLSEDTDKSIEIVDNIINLFK